MSDVEIVQGLRNGERDAWEALCQRYSSRIWRYVARLIGRDQNSVADVFQETMLAAAQSGRGLALDSKLWGWLSTLGHRQAALYWRKRYRELDWMSPSDLKDAKSQEDPADSLDRSETVESIRSLLTEMDADYVVVLTAKHMDGLSVNQIAELLGATCDAVRSRLARARQEFRKRYARLTKDHNLQVRTHEPD